jgi:hypothetical protein
VWLELVMIAHALLAWTKTLLLEGALAKAEPKRLRYRLLRVAARLAFHGRRARLGLQHDWPSAGALAAAFAKLKALPPASADPSADHDRSTQAGATRTPAPAMNSSATPTHFRGIAPPGPTQPNRSTTPSPERPAAPSATPITRLLHDPG